MLAKIAGKMVKINWHHELFAEPHPLKVKNGEVLTKGYTLCQASDLDTDLDVAEGFAWCSILDNFEKERGRKRSLTMVLDRMGLPREERAKVWEAYFARGVVKS